jgi:hypothetical protein
MLKQNKLILTTRAKFWHCKSSGFGDNVAITLQPYSQSRCDNRLCVSSCLSVHLSARNSATPTGQIFVKFNISDFFSKKLVFETVRLWLKSGKITTPYITIYVSERLYNCDRLFSVKYELNLKKEFLIHRNNCEVRGETEETVDLQKQLRRIVLCEVRAETDNSSGTAEHDGLSMRC